MFEVDYKPAVPKNKNLRIGIIGAGEIVRDAHLPAYQLAGFEVVGIYNRTVQRAESVAQQFNIPNVCKTMEELINHPEVDIVDIAVTADLQPKVEIGRAHV